MPVKGLGCAFSLGSKENVNILDEIHHANVIFYKEFVKKLPILTKNVIMGINVYTITKVGTS